jgi:DNA-binding XRE family transcriptional regulator
MTGDDSYRQVVYAIEALAEVGPNLGRPLVDRIKGSAIHNLKELRPGSAGATEVRILFVFDPWRSAILLVAGDKAGNWSGWYRPHHPARGTTLRDLPERTSRRTGAATMSTVRWSDIRDKHVEAIGREDVERGTSRFISQVRAHRLADMRKRRGLTQREVAQAMGVTVGRVSQVENGELSGIDVLDRYVTALGGMLEVVANFGDEQFKVG